MRIWEWIWKHFVSRSSLHLRLAWEYYHLNVMNVMRKVKWIWQYENENKNWPFLHLRLAWGCFFHHLILLVALPYPFLSSPLNGGLDHDGGDDADDDVDNDEDVNNEDMMCIYLYMDACIGEPSSADPPFSRRFHWRAQQLWIDTEDTTRSKNFIGVLNSSG